MLSLVFTVPARCTSLAYSTATGCASWLAGQVVQTLLAEQPAPASAPSTRQTAASSDFFATSAISSKGNQPPACSAKSEPTCNARRSTSAKPSLQARRLPSSLQDKPATVRDTHLAPIFGQQPASLTPSSASAPSSATRRVERTPSLAAFPTRGPFIAPHGSNLGLPSSSPNPPRRSTVAPCSPAPTSPLRSAAYDAKSGILSMWLCDHRAHFPTRAAYAAARAHGLARIAQEEPYELRLEEARADKRDPTVKAVGQARASAEIRHSRKERIAGFMDEYLDSLVSPATSSPSPSPLASVPHTAPRRPSLLAPIPSPRGVSSRSLPRPLLWTRQQRPASERLVRDVQRSRENGRWKKRALGLRREAVLTAAFAVQACC
ncbi:hypothetical protein Rhopal_005005-T1 [Rhodotorula paludigena]|uniref:Proteophosphoglycan ppg4 n=1 Tax=Rhodotorula paludigena TaxID=86838 RepID=A0AAV5GRH8_9BASI|nr:hypothetical protein Rhopal_005005-T1 [Rhodotorula paludigena]